jgi:glyoxylate reductase
MAACAARGIPVVNLPHLLADATADLALAMLLGLSRRMADGEALARSGRWKGWALDQIFGVGLAGKTCGILGAGPIGRAFARRVAALGMRPVFWARAANDPVDFGAGTAERLALPELLPQCAVLSIHCPLTPGTRNLLSAQHLSLLPPGAFIINTAQGGILDEEAAIQLLHQGVLAGVGMDVYEGEPDINKAWFTAPRALLQPHLGSATRETREAMAECVCDGIAAILEGKLG